MPRDLAALINTMLPHVPASQEHLVAGMKSIRSSAEFSPPEVHPLHWNRLRDLLGHHIPTATEPWHETLKKLWVGEEKRPAPPAGKQPATIRGDGARVHHLKCWPEHYAKLVTNEKRFEIRKDDRDFQLGDLLNLSEWDPNAPEPVTGRSLMRRVTHLLRDFPGLQPDFVLMSVASIEDAADTAVRAEIARTCLQLSRDVVDLKAELAKQQEHPLHPDWSKLQETRESLREHMRSEGVLRERCRRLEVLLARSSLKWDHGTDEELASEIAKELESACDILTKPPYILIVTNGTARLVPVDEPVFLLRGQDVAAAAAVRFWAMKAMSLGADPSILAVAEEQAKRMDAWAPKKVPDLPR